MKTPTHVDIDFIDEVRRETEAEEIVLENDAGMDAADNDIVDEDIDPADRLPKHARKNADGSVTLPLMHPRQLTTRKDGKIRERKFEDLVMHRLTGADQRAIAGVSDDLTNVVAFARSTRMSQAVMNVLYDKLDMADINAMGQVLSHFFGSGQKTGK